jgi:hypothetical protein
MSKFLIDLEIDGKLGVREGGVSPQFYTYLQGGDQAADIIYTLPTSLPIANKLLEVTSAGVLSWVSAPAGCSFGTTTQIPYTNAGGTGFLYSNNFKFDGTSLIINDGSAVTGVAPSIRKLGIAAAYSGFLFYPSSGTNANMTFSISPRGTGVAENRAQFSILNTDYVADSVNYEFCTFRATGTLFDLFSGKAGTGTARDLRISANNAGVGSDQLYIKVGGNIGINTTTPGEKLQVDGNILLLDNYKSLYGTGKDASILYNGTNMVFNSREVGTGDFIFSGGNVGIGTTTPNAPLTISGSSDAGMRIYRASATALAGPYNIWSRARGTIASPTVVSSDDTLGYFRAEGYDGSSYKNAVRIGFEVDGTPGTNDMPGRIVFETTPDGSTTLTERMRITSTGNVGIGTTTPGEKLEVNGNIQLTADNNILKFGTGEDASITYDGTNWIFNPKVVGTGYVSILGGLKTAGERISGVTTAVDTYNVLGTDETVICNKSTAFTVTLPVATVVGQKFTIKNINTGAVTIEGNGADTIDGELTQIANRWESIQLQCYVANAWVIL